MSVSLSFIGRHLGQGETLAATKAAAAVLRSVWQPNCCVILLTDGAASTPAVVAVSSACAAICCVLQCVGRVFFRCRTAQRVATASVLCEGMKCVLFCCILPGLSWFSSVFVVCLPQGLKEVAAPWGVVVLEATHASKTPDERVALLRRALLHARTVSTVVR